MNKQKIYKFRLLLNGAGCLLIIMVCLPTGIRGLIDLMNGSLRLMRAPRFAATVGLQVTCAILGVVAIVSFVRTARAWRRLNREQ